MSSVPKPPPILAPEGIDPQELCLNPPFKHAHYPIADEHYFNVPRPILKMQHIGRLPENFKHQPASTISQFDTDVEAYKRLSDQEWLDVKDSWTTVYQKYYVDHSPYHRMMAFDREKRREVEPRPDCYMFDRPQSLFPKVPLQHQENELAIAARTLAQKYKSPQEVRAAQLNWGKFLRENPERFKFGKRSVIPRQSDFHFNGSRIIYQPPVDGNYRMHLRDQPSDEHCYKLQPINLKTLYYK